VKSVRKFRAANELRGLESKLHDDLDRDAGLTQRELWITCARRPLADAYSSGNGSPLTLILLGAFGRAAGRRSLGCRLQQYAAGLRARIPSSTGVCGAVQNHPTLTVVSGVEGAHTFATRAT
jgi:hypothetical protein